MLMQKSIAAAALLCLAAIAGAAEKITISGSVLDELGNPLAKSSVSVNGAQARTDGQGHYRLDVPESELYRLAVSANGHYRIIHTFSHHELASRAIGPFTVPAVKLVARKPGRTLFAFAGDAMMGRRYLKPHAGEPVLIRPGHEKQDIKALLKEVKPYLALADYTSVNLETPVVAKKPAGVATKSVVISAHPGALGALRWAGVDYVTLGNNHTYDYLEPGLKETLAHLENSGLGFSGAGVNEAQALRPYRTKIKGHPYSFLGYVGWPGRFAVSQVAEINKGGPALGSLANIRSSVAKEAADGQTTIVQYHGGHEYTEAPTRMTEHRLKSAISEGADLAIGHHPHATQGYEIYQDKLIAYSLGNFLFDQYIYSTQLTAMLYVWMDGDRFHRAELAPVYIKGYVPTPATGATRQYVLKRLATLSGRRNLIMQVSGGNAVINPAERLTKGRASQYQTKAAPGVTALHRQAWSAFPVSVNADKNSGVRYRLGNDILIRGDFESHHYFDAPDRSWYFSNAASGISDEQALSGDLAMKITVPAAGTATAGMRKFDRVFTRSTPASVVAGIYTDKPVRVSAYLQGRPRSMGVAQALESGPKELLGSTNLGGRNEWQNLAFAYNSPRDAKGYKSIRILFEINALEPDTDALVYLDDIALVEWQTPFLNAGEASGLPFPNRATHLEISGPGGPMAITIQMKSLR